MIRDLPGALKHWLDFGAFTGVLVASVTLANAALFMSFLAATCSVLWFVVRFYDRIKYGPDFND